jgi:hypothetical protein
MSERIRNPEIEKQIIIELWGQTGKQSAGKPELELIQQGLFERFGTAGSASPAAIARTLADHGVLLRHPEIMEADLRWRQDRMTALLNFETLERATVLIEKIERLHREFGDDEGRLEHLRQSVRRIKSELDLLANREKAEKRRQLAQEVAQWLTVWLQTPQIFAEWLGLRRATTEFRERFE